VFSYFLPPFSHLLPRQISPILSKTLQYGYADSVLFVVSFIMNHKKNRTILGPPDSVTIKVWRPKILKGEPLSSPTTAYDFHPLLCTEQGKGCMDDVHTIDF
jgi:hypothetical protein